MLPLDVAAIGAAYYAGNCHKWLCAPKTAGFLHVRRDLQEMIRPLAISHGATRSRAAIARASSSSSTGRARSTRRRTSRVPEAIRFLGAVLPGGWPALREHNRALGARRTPRRSATALDGPDPAPDAMIGSLAAVPIADGSAAPPTSGLYCDPLQDALRERRRHRGCPSFPGRAAAPLVRISAALYNTVAEYEELARQLVALR